MLDTMTMTKVTGALCGSLLVFLLGGWAAEEIYHAGSHGHHEQSYIIPVETVTEEVVVEEGPSFDEVYAMAVAADGESLFNRACASCHSLSVGDNGTGPYLYGIVGRAVQEVDGFGYSGALAAAADVWTPENLNAFLEGPRGFAQGTSMSYNGMRKIEDRANLIAYLDSLDD